MADHYSIRVRGHLDQSWSAWFDGFTITHTAHGETILAGLVADQAVLYGLLSKVRDLGLTLLAVRRVGVDGADGSGAGAPGELPAPIGKAPDDTGSLHPLG